MKDSKRYSELARYANDHGYAELKPDTVQYWTRRGLVSHAEAEHVGFAVRVRTESIWAGRVLLRACHYRYGEGIRDISQIGVLVWLECLPVAEELVRDGLKVYASAAPRLLERVSRGSELADAAISKVIQVAADKVVYDHRFAEHQGVSRADRGSGIADLLDTLLLGKDAKTAELTKLGQLFGVTEFGERIVTIRSLLTPSALNDRVSTATTAELEAARERALVDLDAAGSSVSAIRIVTVLAHLVIGEGAHSG